LDDVRSERQLLEGLHYPLELVCPLRVKLRLVELLLHPTNAQHAVDVIRSKLLLRLTEANHLLTEARDPLTEARCLLLRAKTSLDAGQTELWSLQTEVARCLRALQTELRALKTKTARCLRALKTQLPTLQRADLRQLLCAETQAATSFRCTRRSARPDLAQLPSCLRRLKRAVCCGLKAAGPHLCSGPSLLLEDVPLKLLLCDGLTRATKGSGLNSLPTDLLLRKLPLASDVRHRLLYRSLFKGAHELERRLGRKTSDTLSCGTHPKVGGFHELALGLSRGRAGAICRNVGAGDASACRRLDAPCCSLCRSFPSSCRRLDALRCPAECFLAGSNLPWDLTGKSPSLIKGCLQRPHTLFSQACGAVKVRLVWANALTRNIERALLVCRKLCDLLLW
jgi:hypothetical protein